MTRVGQLTDQAAELVSLLRAELARDDLAPSQRNVYEKTIDFTVEAVLVIRECCGPPADIW